MNKHILWGMKRDKIEPAGYASLNTDQAEVLFREPGVDRQAMYSWEQVEKITTVIAQEAASIARYHFHPRDQFNHRAGQYIAEAIEAQLLKGRNNES